MKFKKYFCKKCGKTWEVEIEEDEYLTKVICPKCNRKMWRVKDEP